MAVLLIGIPYEWNMDEQTVTARHTRPVTFILHDCTPFRHGLGKFRKSPMGTHFPKAGIRVVAPRVEMDSGFWGNDVEARFAFVGMWGKGTGFRPSPE
jgi:hypothetical protein